MEANENSCDLCSSVPKANCIYLPCGHYICRKCLLNNTSCPICYNEIPIDFLEYYDLINPVDTVYCPNQQDYANDNSNQETAQIFNDPNTFNLDITFRNKKSPQKIENPIQAETIEVIPEPAEDGDENPKPDPKEDTVHDQNENQNIHDANEKVDNGAENNEEEESWICSICYEEVREPRLTPCGHLFCKRCIEEWLQRSSVCPICNTHNVTTETLIAIEGQGLPEDRPPPDNTAAMNTPMKRLKRILFQWSTLYIALSLLLLIFVCFIN